MCEKTDVKPAHQLSSSFYQPIPWMGDTVFSRGYYQTTCSSSFLGVGWDWVGLLFGALMGGLMSNVNFKISSKEKCCPIEFKK